jgi:hypothetical protein
MPWRLIILKGYFCFNHILRWRTVFDRLHCFTLIIRHCQRRALTSSKTRTITSYCLNYTAMRTLIFLRPPPPPVNWSKEAKFSLNTTWRRMVEWGIAPFTGWMLVVSFTIRPLYSRGKCPTHPLKRRLGGTQGPSGIWSEPNKSSPHFPTLFSLRSLLIISSIYTYTLQIVVVPQVFRSK